MTGGGLGNITPNSFATAPASKIQWIESARWWNPLCSNQLYAGRRNNRIGTYNASLAFYQLVAGSCTICITPVHIVDVFLRPESVIQGVDVTGVGMATLASNINTIKPKDWTYCWTRPDTEVNFKVLLSYGVLQPEKDYTALIRFHARKCGPDGVLKKSTDPQTSLSMFVEWTAPNAGVTKSDTVSIGTEWSRHVIPLTPADIAPITSLEGSERLTALQETELLFSVAASGGDPEEITGVAISWAEVVFLLV